MRAINSTPTDAPCKIPSPEFTASPYSDPDLPAGARLLARTLRDEWARQKDACWPSDKRIAEKTGLSTGHTQRCLRLLEQAGYIRRQTDVIRRPDGRLIRRRLIYLLWHPSLRAEARTRPAPARDGACAPATRQNLVVGSERENPDPSTTERPRPDRSADGPRQDGPSSLAPALAQILRQTAAQRPGPTPDRAPRLSASPTVPPRTTDAPREPIPPPTTLQPWPIATRPSSPPPVPPCPSVATSSPGLVGMIPSGVLGAAERARLQELPESRRRRVVQWLGLGDPICLREAYRLLSPAPPCEPPVSSRPTRELLEALPGRHDLVAAATQRLVEELSDSSSWGYYRKVATSVASREHAPDALIACWSQATGPRARHPGALFASAWKRSSSVVR